MPEAFDPYYKWLGIPRAEQPANHYRLLAINLFEDDLDVIESAADRQMAHVRTFQAGSHSALSQKLLNELSAAKICLLDPSKRAAYDAELRRPTLVSPPRPTALAPRPPRPAPVQAISPVLVERPAPAEFVIDRNPTPRAGAKIRPRRRNSGWPAAAVAALAAVIFVGYLIWTRPESEPVTPMPPVPLPANGAAKPDSIALAPPDPPAANGTTSPEPKPSTASETETPVAPPTSDPPSNPGAEQTAPFVPADAVSFAHHKYKFYPQRLSWKEARDRCESLGGNLAVIDSLAENSFVGELVAKANWQDAWTGATDEAEEGRWRNVEGELLDFTNWYTRQPDNNNLEEHYALISNNSIGGKPMGWRWSDQPNESKQHQPGFVCEWASSSDSEGFAPLFNGKDLTGWKTHPSEAENWRVDDGILIGSGLATSHLFSERGNFTNIHLRVESRINEGGNGGIYCRSPFGPVGLAKQGYEAQIDGVRATKNNTGSLYAPESGVARAVGIVRESPVSANEWFTLELIATDNHVVVKVNGQTTADYFDSARNFATGHIALHQVGSQTVVQFRKIEIRESALPVGETAKSTPNLTPSGLQIINARWGAGSNWVDVTKSMQAGVRNGRYLATVDAPALGKDPAWGIVKNLTVRYSIGAEAHTDTFKDGQVVYLAADDAEAVHSPGLTLVEAKYGWGHDWIDVLDRIKPLVKGDALSVRPDRVVGVDPRPGATKVLFVRYALNGKAAHASVLNHEVLSIGERSRTADASQKSASAADGAPTKPAKTAEPGPKPRSLGSLANDRPPPEQGKLTATEAFALKQHTAAVTRVAFHRTKPLLASAGKDGQVLLWNLQAGGLPLQVHKYAEEVWTVKFHPTLDLLAYANRRWWGSQLYFKTLAGVQVGKPIKDFKDPGGEVWAIAYSHDGRLLAAGQVDGTIRLWDSSLLRESSPVGLGARHNVYALAFGAMAADRKLKQTKYLLAEGGEDGEVRTYSVTIRNDGQWSFDKTNVGFPKAAVVLGLRFSPDGKLLGCTRRDGTIELYDPEAPANVRRLVGAGRGAVWWIAFHPNYPKLPWCVTAHQDSQVARIWNTVTGDLLCELKGHTGGVMCAEFSPDGRHVATASEDLSIQVWNLAGRDVPAAPKKKARLSAPIVGD